MPRTSNQELRRCDENGKVFVADADYMNHPPSRCPYCGAESCLEDNSE